MFNSFKKFSFLYLGAMLFYLGSIFLENLTVHHITKPLFLVLLMGFHHVQLEGKYDTFSKLIIFGLFFSWVGDVALMIDKTGAFFIVGLGSFLIAHLGYSIGFYRNISTSDVSFNYKKAIFYAIPFLLVTVPFFLYIKPGIPDDFFIPVLAYTSVITIMGMFSVWRYGHVNTKSFRWMSVGAVLFILSDCVLATNLFALRPEAFSETAKLLAATNMLLYLSGQFMITTGAIYHRKTIN
jgi:uncharacterized membrane protein YhhN